MATDFHRRALSGQEAQKLGEHGTKIV
jgi:hypothetical protein